MSFYKKTQFLEIIETPVWLLCLWFLFLLWLLLLVMLLVVVVVDVVTNDHLGNPASCKLSSGGIVLLQMVIWRDQPLANHHLEDMASCK